MFSILSYFQWKGKSNLEKPMLYNGSKMLSRERVGLNTQIIKYLTERFQLPSELFLSEVLAYCFYSSPELVERMVELRQAFEPIKDNLVHSLTMHNPVEEPSYDLGGSRLKFNLDLTVPQPPEVEDLLPKVRALFFRVQDIPEAPYEKFFAAFLEYLIHTENPRLYDESIQRIAVYSHCDVQLLRQLITYILMLFPREQLYQFQLRAKRYFESVSLNDQTRTEQAQAELDAYFYGVETRIKDLIDQFFHLNRVEQTTVHSRYLFGVLSYLISTSQTGVLEYQASQTQEKL